MKKKLACILSLLAATISLGPIFFGTWFLGFLLTKYMAGRTSGTSGRVKSIIIPVGKHKIHFHHWLISTVIIILALAMNIPLLTSPISYGLLGGSVFQGIYSYSDWNKILVSPRIGVADSSSLDISGL